MAYLTFGQDLISRMRQAGILPEAATRCVIDIQLDKPVMLYWQTYADERLLQVITPESLDDALHVQVDQPQPTPQDDRLPPIDSYGMLQGP